MSAFNGATLLLLFALVATIAVVVKCIDAGRQLDEDIPRVLDEGDVPIWVPFTCDTCHETARISVPRRVVHETDWATVWLECERCVRKVTR